MKSTILITGGAGYIGSHIAFLLAEQGFSIVIIDDFRHNQIFSPSWATIYRGSVGDPTLLDAIFYQHTVDAVIHCAGSIEVGESVKQPLTFYQNNVSNTITLLNTMHKHKIRKLLFSSSCAVYGKPHVIPIPEEHQKKPLSPYGKTKHMIEQIIHDAHIAHDLTYVTFRFFNAAGGMPEYNLFEQHTPETHLIPLIFRAFYDQALFTVFGNRLPTQDGTCVRDFIHPWDIAHAHLSGLKHLNQNLPSETFNLGTGKGYSVLQIIEAAQHLVNKELKLQYSAPREGDAAVLIADPSRAQNILTWRPRFSDLKFIMETAYATIHPDTKKERFLQK